MPICEKCGSMVKAGIEKCPFCGNPISSAKDKKHFLQNSSEEATPEKKEKKLVSRDDDSIKAREDETSFTIVDTNINSNLSNRSAEQRKSSSETPVIEDTIGIFSSPSIEEILPEEQTRDSRPQKLEEIPMRNYWQWLAIGILTLGIGFLIYLYLNLVDLERHSHYPDEPLADPIEVNTFSIMMLFLVSICCGFIPILWWVYYKKYAALYFHIKEQKENTAPYKIPHPALYLVVVIPTHLIALIPTIYYFITGIDIQQTIPTIFWMLTGFIILFTIGSFVFDYLWQRAFNTHSKITMQRFRASQ
jgi:hypothetical protein